MDRETVHELIQSHHVHHRVHGSHIIGRFNASVARRLSGVFGSMYFFWFCFLLDVAALIWGNPGAWTILQWVAFLSQTVIQLLALPVLGVMANIQQAASDARAETDHQTLTILHQLSKQQLEILTKLDERSDLQGGSVTNPHPDSNVRT